MRIMKNVSLKLYSTMRLGGTADFVTEAKTKTDLEKAASWAESRQLPIRVIGDGSNIIWRQEGFKGLLVINRIGGFKKLSEDSTTATYQIGAGENWDTVVDQLVGLGLQGVECLSLIPGTAGATPIQNVGAYGQDISQTLVELEAYDRMEKSFTVVSSGDCGFSYRSSRFKTVDNGRFLISTITLKLHKDVPRPPFYDALQLYLDKKKLPNPNLKQIRDAVIAIRSQKLPDPSKIANNGSYFANPFVDKKQLDHIRLTHKDVKVWEIGKNHYKLSAAWLVEAAGFKGKLDAETGMTTWKNQSLVLVNERAKTTSDLLAFQDKITDKVFELFGVNLEREPELLP